MGVVKQNCVPFPVPPKLTIAMIAILFFYFFNSFKVDTELANHVNIMLRLQYI